MSVEKREIISVLSVMLGVGSNMVLGAMHDRASSAAMRTVRIMYPDVVDIGCVSHTLDLVGDSGGVDGRFCTKFSNSLETLSLFSASVTI